MLGAGEPYEGLRLQSGSKTVSTRSAPPPLLAPDPIWDPSLPGRIALSWQQPELEEEERAGPLDKERRTGGVGEPPSRARAAGSAPKLAFGCDCPIQALPHAGWANLDKPPEGNSLQQGGEGGGGGRSRCQAGTVGGAVPGAPWTGSYRLLPGGPPWPGPPGVRVGKVRACPGPQLLIVLFRPLPGVPDP